MLLCTNKYKSKYHLLLCNHVSSRTKNKVRLELGLYHEVQVSNLQSIQDMLDYYILTQNIQGIRSCFTLFKKKFFLTRRTRNKLLQKFYPYLMEEVEQYARINKFYFICSYFDYKYIRFNKSDDYYFLLANNSTNKEDKKNYVNSYFLSSGLSLISTENLFGKSSFYISNSKNKYISHRVSVIMTSFNNEANIEKSIYSILNQYSVDIELIIVDDASSDSTVDIIKKITLYDSRVRPFFLNKNIGTYAAKNIALSMASGKYLAFQDADDFSHPERLIESILRLEKQKYLVAVSSRYIRLTDQGQFVSSKKIPLIRWSPLTLVIKREIVLTELREFDSVRFGADSEFFARLIASFGIKAHAIIDKVLMICSDRENSLMKENASFFGFSIQRKDYQNFYNERILRELHNNK